jgi:hypothetical protein
VGPDKMLTFDQFWERYTSISSQLIYDVKHKLKFISPKSTTRLLSLRDTYSQRGNDFAELEIFKNYTQGVRKLGESKFTNPVYSQKYYLDLSE